MRGRKFIFPLIILIIFPVLHGCGEADKIEEDTFVNFYCDMILAQDSLGRNQEAMDEIQRKLFERYSVTYEDYIATVEYYNTTPRGWEIFFNKALEEMQRRKQEALSSATEEGN